MFSKWSDADILQKIDVVDDKQGYIKRLIRADIEREKENDKKDEV